MKIKNDHFSLLWVPHHPGHHYASTCEEILAVWKRVKKLHDQGFVHFDLHWGNVVVKRDGSVALLDFDLGGNEGRVVETIHLNRTIAGVNRSEKIFDANHVKINRQHDVYMVCQLIEHSHSGTDCERWNFLKTQCQTSKPETMGDMLEWTKRPVECTCVHQWEEEREEHHSKSHWGTGIKKGFSTPTQT